MMPSMSGYEVAQKLRKKYLASELPIIMVTAKNQVSDLVQGLHTGANDYLAKPFTKDEFLARLQTHLNLRQINDVTSRFVPTEFIRAIGRETITEVQLGDNKAQDITVLFTDIRGYTGLSEAMSPEENFRFVQAYAGRMGPIIHRNHGFVNQYLGDGIMALFQRKGEDALQAAIDMQRRVWEYNQQRISKGRDPIKVGMGLHTGPLIMGIIGDSLRSDPAVIADTVNTASRLEGLTKYYGSAILVSEDSLDTMGSDYRSGCRYLGLVQVKGRQQPMGLYECFLGDEPDVIKRKQAIASNFDAAVQAYLMGDMKLAVAKFAPLSEGGDQTAQYFLTKALHYRDKGVPKDWIGVDVMMRK